MLEKSIGSVMVEVDGKLYVDMKKLRKREGFERAEYKKQKPPRRS